MKSFLKIVIFLFLSFLTCFTKQVSQEKAGRIALNWFQSRTGLPKDQLNIKEIFFIKDNDDTILYVFNINPKGFVIVSADDIIIPVIMYSDEGFYIPEDTPPALMVILENVKNDIVNSRKNNYMSDRDILEKWRNLSENISEKKQLKKLGVQPLINTLWSQKSPYNKFCPTYKDLNITSPVGCVATAMSQIMKYHNWPIKGVSSFSYVHSVFDTLSADFGNTTYDWTNMPSVISMGGNVKYIDAVALLSYHCGISVSTVYGKTASSANSPDVRDALVLYFRYSSDAVYLQRKMYNLPDWQNLIRNELSNRRPVYYRGGGHAFIVDGYDDLSYFHLNWGWGGSSNGYFYIDKLVVGQYNFNIDDGAIINIRPDTCPLKPYIHSDKNYVKFWLKNAKTIPQAQNICIKNLGNSPLNWTISRLPDWLEANPSSGVDSINVSLSLKNNNIEPGRYIDSIVITATGALNSPQKIAVELLSDKLPENLDWIVKSAGKGNKYVNEVCSDWSGNIYIVGSFPGELILENKLAASFGDNDIFLAKYNPYGNIQWLKSGGGKGNDNGMGIAADNFGNIYITGSYSGSVRLGNNTIDSIGKKDIFIAKFDNDGNNLWVKGAGGKSDDISNKIEIDDQNNIYITGSFQDNCAFGSQQFISNGSDDIFAAKYDTDGNLLWVQKAGGDSSDVGKALEVDKENNVYITGNFQGVAKFGELQLSSNGESDVFLVKYNSSGVLQWARKAGGKGSDHGTGVCVDGNSDIYFTGDFRDSMAMENLKITGNGGSDVFVGKYNKLGCPLMVINFGGNILEYGGDICTDVNSNCYITGLTGSIFNICEKQIRSYSKSNLFTIKFNSSDSPVWYDSFAGVETYNGSRICIDNNLNYIVAGSLCYDEKNTDIFIAKITNIMNTVFENEFSKTTQRFSLKQNYPNPFNPTTNIEIDLSVSSYITAKIYDLLGGEITTLTSGYLNKGNHKFLWNAAGKSGGIYYLRVNGYNPSNRENYSEVKKMILVK